MEMNTQGERLESEETSPCELVSLTTSLVNDHRAMGKVACAAN